MRIWKKTGKKDVLTELGDKSVVGLYGRGDTLDCEREQSRVSGIEHRVISPIAGAVAVASLQKQARGGKRGLGLAKVGLR